MRRILTLLGIALLLASCSESRSVNPMEETRILMDTVVRVAVYDSDLNNVETSRTIEQTFAVMQNIEGWVSTYSDTSDISRINATASGPVAVKRETMEIIQKALEVSGFSAGAFDVTIKPVKDLWGFETDHPGLPDPAKIRAALAFVDYQAVELGPEGLSIPKPGMALDLGALAKGYIVDAGVAVLKAAGIRSGIVDAGGDLHAFGPHPTRETWNIGIKHPRNAEGGLYGVIGIQEGSVATSGDYERYFTVQNQRYHHILDPRSGYPADRCASVTIFAKTAVDADAFATAVFVLGPNEGMTLIESRPDLEGLILIDRDEGLYEIASEGFKQLMMKD